MIILISQGYFLHSSNKTITRPRCPIMELALHIPKAKVIAKCSMFDLLKYSYKSQDI